jgi:hypothetical protein
LLIDFHKTKGPKCKTILLVVFSHQIMIGWQEEQPIFGQLIRRPTSSVALKKGKLRLTHICTHAAAFALPLVLLHVWAS